MKTLIRSDRGRVFKLLIDVPGMDDDEKPVLAKMQIYEGTGCWTIEDVRLSEHGRPSKHFDVGAEAFWSSHTADTPEDLTMATALLREYQLRPTADGGAVIDWCTFNGIVRGRPAWEVTSLSDFFTMGLRASPIYFKRHEALDYLKNAAADWSLFPHSEADPDIAIRAGTMKLDNPIRQPTALNLEAMLCTSPHYRRQDRNKKSQSQAQELHDKLLIAATSKPDDSAIEELASAGAPVNGIDGDGVPLREIVVQNRSYNIPRLIASGADPNALYDCKGKDPAYAWPTALHLAVEHRREISVVYLLAAGADPNLRLPGGLSAFELSAKMSSSRLQDAFTHPLQVAAALDMRDAAIQLAGLGHDPRAVVASKSFGYVGKKRQSAIARADGLGYGQTAHALRALAARREAQEVSGEIQASRKTQAHKALTP